jgi:NADPH:quinone reductase-like Zn-dependent oxidoreductase
LVDEGRLQSAITATVPFDDLPSGLQRMADRAAIGKLVMVP